MDCKGGDFRVSPFLRVKSKDSKRQAISQTVIVSVGRQAGCPSIFFLPFSEPVSLSVRYSLIPSVSKSIGLSNNRSVSQWFGIVSRITSHSVVK